MKKFSLALVSLGSISAATVFAQTSPALTLAPITVTGNPLGAIDFIACATQYSASDTRGAAVGGSVFFSQGYVGASVSRFLSDYGTEAEDEASIGMKADRYAVAGELRGLGGLFQSVKGQLGRSVYEHTEYEGATAARCSKTAAPTCGWKHATPGWVHWTA